MEGNEANLLFDKFDPRMQSLKNTLIFPVKFYCKDLLVWQCNT